MVLRLSSWERIRFAGAWMTYPLPSRGPFSLVGKTWQSRNRFAGAWGMEIEMIGKSGAGNSCKPTTKRCGKTLRE